MRTTPPRLSANSESTLARFIVAAFVWPAAARELVCVGRALKVLSFAEGIEPVLLLDDSDVELRGDGEVGLGITERSRACEIWLAWASLTVA